MYITTVGGEELFLLIQVRTVAGDNALGVEHQDILFLGTQGHIQLGTRDSSGTGTVHHDAYLFDILTVHLKRVLQSGGRNNCRTMLIIMHHGDVERFLQTILNIEALRSLDILQVDTAEGRGDLLHCFAELLGVFFIHLNIEDVNTAVDLEKQSFSFHHGLTAHGTDVTQSEYGCTVTDDCHQITFIGIFVCSVGVLLYLKTREGYTWRIGQT